MTEIDKAVEHYRYGISHDIFSEPVTTYARLAAASLQEKQEREKGCEYCRLGIKAVSMKFPTTHEYGGTRWTESVRAPKYCPMCGAKLEAEAMAAIAGGD